MTCIFPPTGKPMTAKRFAWLLLIAFTVFFWTVLAVDIVYWYFY